MDNPFGDLAADDLIHDFVKTVQQYQAFPVQEREVLMFFDQPIQIASRVSMGILSHRNPNKTRLLDEKALSGQRSLLLKESGRSGRSLKNGLWGQSGLRSLLCKDFLA